MASILQPSSLLDGLLFGFFFSSILLGIMIAMGWKYIVVNSDGWPLQLLVCTCIILSLSAAGSKVAMARHFMADGFGDTAALSEPYIMTDVAFLLSGIVFFLVHIFFATRLWLLTRNRYVPTLIAIISTVMLGMNAYTAFGPNRHVVEIGTIVFHGLALTADLLVTGAFSYYLFKSKSDAFSSGTVKALDKLLNFIVTRGMLLALVQIPHVAMYLRWRHEMLFWLSLHLVLDPLDVITMLAMLNSRPAANNLILENNHLDFDLESPSYTARSTCPSTLQSHADHHPHHRVDLEFARSSVRSSLDSEHTLHTFTKPCRPLSSATLNDRSSVAGGVAGVRMDTFPGSQAPRVSLKP